MYFHNTKISHSRRKKKFFGKRNNQKGKKSFWKPFLVFCALFIISGSLLSWIYAATVTDGSVTIDVPDYDPANGWEAGTIYDAKVTVDFADTTSINKTITITLPEGMRFVNYPVVGAPTAGTPGYELDSDGVLASFITNTVDPPKQTYYPSYNGTLTYNLTTACESIEIPFKVTVDENVYYEPKTIPNAINATASKGFTNLGNASMDVNGVGSIIFSINTAAWQTVEALEGSSDPVVLQDYRLRRVGFLHPLPFYVKEITTHYYYPKEVEITSMSHVDNMVNHDEINGDIFYRWNNRFGGDIFFETSASVENTEAGLYTAIDKPRFQLTMYDDAVINVTNYSPMKIDVISSVDNKLQLTTQNSLFYKYSDDYNTVGPHIRIFNDQATNKTNQYVEYTIDPNYEVIQAVFPVDPTLGAVGDVQYKTNLNPTLRTADPSDVVTFSSNGKYISVDSLGLSANEYLTYVNASIGGVSKGYESINPYLKYLNNQSRLVGKLKDGVDTADVTVRTYALLPDDSIEPNSEVSSTRSVNRIANPTATLNAYSYDVTMDAGETKNLTFTLNGTAHYWGDLIGMVNPNAYIRIPENTEIDIDSITVTSNKEGAVPFTVTGPYTSAVSGEEFVKIAITGKVGSLFDLETYHAMRLNFDLIAGLDAGGNYPWEEYVFWNDDVGGNYVPQYSYPTSVSDVLDMDNDGDTADKFLPVYNADLTIFSKEELLIDTYIVPEGGERQVPYDGTEDTAIGFTPGTTATYTVDMLNNRTDSVNSTTAYIPIPKDGNNFGTNFQDNEFYWNMKLSGTPTVTVYDEFGTDITASAASNYTITYSEDAANASNYETATYTATPSANTTMIKVENTTGIPAGEQAILEFDYVVDETIATVTADPTKLGATNDFRPYYYFNSGTSGWQSGTKVGAILQIGQIAGQVFLDQDIDGIYNNADTLLQGKTIDLYKHDGSTYVFHSTTTTDTNGNYSFDELSNGNYRVDFTNVPAATQKFTKQDQGTDESLDSDTPYTGTNTGQVDNIDPTDTAAQNTDAGVINYDPATDLSVSLNKTTTSIKKTNAQTSFTEQLVETITPTFFDSIKATSQPIAWTSSDPTTVSVSNGLIQGSQVGSAVITLTITDMYGNTDTAQTDVTVTSNDIPTLTANNLTIDGGTIFDPLTLPTASDTEDGDLTSSITVTNNPVDTSIANTYTVSYAVTDSDGNTATKDITVTVQAITPTVSTQSPTDITTVFATGNGTITNNGGDDPERFIQWGTTSGNYTNECSAGTESTGTYSCDMTDLSANTTYYVRAYATNAAGTSYGTEISFTTPTVSPDTATQPPTVITRESAIGNATVTDTGGDDPERFIQWGTESGVYTNSCSAGTGSTGTYSCDLTDLSPNTTYYVQAYATNSVGTGYGTEISFKTLLPLSYTIEDPTDQKMTDAVTDGYFTLTSGASDNTDGTTTQTEITFQKNTLSALFPTNTTITEQSAGSFNFQNFTLQEVNVTNEQPDSRVAVRLGVPGEKLDFSQDITMTVFVGNAYNDQEMDILYQNEGESTWNTHGTCVIEGGNCTFTTNHATIYTINGNLQATGSAPVEINTEVVDTLTLDCYDTTQGTGNYDVTLGTTSNPGFVTAGTPAVGTSTCDATTNDDQGYYLSVVDDNAATNTVLTHNDPNTAAVYEIQDLTQYTESTPNTINWNAPTTKGLGFSVITFPDTDTANNTFDGVWNETSQCPEGTNPDSNDYAGIPDTPEAIAAVPEYSANQTTTEICYKVDVPASQPSGIYTGSVTYTATSDASSYLN